MNLINRWNAYLGPKDERLVAIRRRRLLEGELDALEEE